MAEKGKIKKLLENQPAAGDFFRSILNAETGNLSTTKNDYRPFTTVSPKTGESRERSLYYSDAENCLLICVHIHGIARCHCKMDTGCLVYGQQFKSLCMMMQLNIFMSFLNRLVRKTLACIDIHP